MAQYSAVVLNPPGASVSKAWASYQNHQVGQAGGTVSQTGALWSGTSASAIPLTPTGYALSYAYGVDATHQVGMARGTPNGNAFHAFLWSGSANAFIDLNPPGYGYSVAYAIDGSLQGGQATTSAAQVHAGIWYSSAASFVDLHPLGASESHIYGAAGGKQVGYSVVGGVEHALLWSSVPGSEIDLNGAFDAAIANGMDSKRVAGTASGPSTGGANHAVVWDVATQAVTDLHPATGFAETQGYCVGGKVTCGFGTGSATGNKVHALAWIGPKLIDLHAFLPSGYSNSYAYGVDPVTGAIVGEAVNNLNRSIAFMWKPVDTVPSRTRVVSRL